MEADKYQAASKRTDLENYRLVLDRLSNSQNLQILHSLIGLVTEVGELCDQFKKHILYGKELDITNMKEESGDLEWYHALLLNAIGSNFSEVMEMNIKKLKARYPEKFTEELALRRDLNAEREVLDGRDS